MAATTSPIPETDEQHVERAAARHAAWAEEMRTVVNDVIVRTLQEGNTPSVENYEDVVRAGVDVDAWAEVTRIVSAGKSVSEAIRAVRTRLEQDIRDSGIMNSTSPMANAVGIVRRDAQIRWSNQAAGIIGE